VQGYTTIVQEHYADFNTSTTTGMEYVRKQEMVAKESYQAAGINYPLICFLFPECLHYS
jgi:hypothetical protein